ncbi:MAG: amidohydrolase family protein [Planctomycetaceae bacterium]
MSRAAAHDVLIRARWVVPMLGPPLAGGWLRIRRGRVVDLGADRRHGRPTAAATIDAGDAVVIPGLVNAHTHLEFSDVERPLDAGGGLPDWIGRVITARRTRMAAGGADACVAAAVRRGLAESAACGVTAVGEIATAVPSDGYPASGPRLRVYREALGLSSAAAATAGRAAVRDLDRLQSRGVAAGLSPHAPYSVTAPLARDLARAARRRRAPLAAHIAESSAEAELLRDAGGPFRELFDRLGIWPPAADPELLPAAEWISLLARGLRGMLVHGTHLDRDEHALARLARHRERVGVAVCPRTTRAISGVLPPVHLFRAAGIRVAIGTDSRASSPDLSVLEECRTLVAGGCASPVEALRMATIDAAWAIGFERVCGLLAPGRPADLAILTAAATNRDAHEAILDPAARVVATLRGGRLIAGALPPSAAG